MTIQSKPCPGCGRVLALEVSQEGYKAWRAGTLIQNAFPNLTSTQRESLITGYCDTCWEKLFAEEEEE